MTTKDNSMESARTSTERLRAAAVLGAYAMRSGLPTPFAVRLESDCIELTFDTLPDLVGWACWLDKSIDSQVNRSCPEETLHTVSGHVLGQRVQLGHVTRWLPDRPGFESPASRSRRSSSRLE
jgi:hypothetical protein